MSPDEETYPDETEEFGEPVDAPDVLVDPEDAEWQLDEDGED